eukprot:scaffold144251_cov19-Tisochrysis_lutea.AAC.1
MRLQDRGSRVQIPGALLIIRYSFSVAIELYRGSSRRPEVFVLGVHSQACNTGHLAVCNECNLVSARALHPAAHPM